MKTIKRLFTILSIALIASCSSESIAPNNGGETTDSRGGGGSTGQGGSLARFTIAKDYLYVVSSNALFSYNLANPSQPEFVGENNIWANVETIFAMGDYLFLGTTTGVEIYDISNPSQPKYTSRYEHIVSCDPVVAQGAYAYSTLRTGTNCWRGENRLDVIDISNISQPEEEWSIVMNNPKGLGISGNYLYVCDNSVLKTFSLINPARPTERVFQQLNIDGCFDVIARENRLLVVHTFGLNQYSINPATGALTPLSSILVD